MKNMNLSLRPQKSPVSALAIAILSTLALSACQTKAPVAAPYVVPTVIAGPSQVLEILPQRVSCDSAVPMQCMMVKVSGSADSEIFGIGFNDIKGFEPRTGVSYRIRAAQEIDESTGKPTGYWQLIEVLSQSLSR